MAEEPARSAGQVPRPTGHVWAAIDDRDRDRPATLGITQGDSRTAWQRPVRHAVEIRAQPVSASRPPTVEAWAIEAHVRVVPPRVLLLAARLAGRLVDDRPRCRDRTASRLAQGRVGVEHAGRTVRGVECDGHHRRRTKSGRHRERPEGSRVEVRLAARGARGGRSSDGDQGGRGDERRDCDDMPGSHAIRDASLRNDARQRPTRHGP